MKFREGSISPIPPSGTAHGSKHMSPKQSSNRLYGSSKTSQIQQKLLVEEANRSKWFPNSSALLVTWRQGALAQRRTVNSEWYTTICLPEVIGEFRKTQKKRRIILHHDNASSHTSAQTKEFLSDQNIEFMGHPSYSPDLAPNDVFLFPYIKNKLRGQRFSTPEEAVDAFKLHVLELPQSEWKKCFKNWFKRMQKFMENILKINQTNFDHKYFFITYQSRNINSNPRNTSAPTTKERLGCSDMTESPFTRNDLSLQPREID